MLVVISISIKSSLGRDKIHNTCIHNSDGAPGMMGVATAVAGTLPWIGGIVDGFVEPQKSIPMFKLVVGPVAAPVGIGTMAIV